MQRARSVTGPLRRAHPASGATWNVQVVRGKMSSQCLWHACRALSAGLLLMLLGAAMAVIGYYADTLSVDQEIRGNSTVSVKDETRGFHLNNLSYAGPIVMGFGGFIVVAACVMTFEARDSAAKVTPARPQAMPRPMPRRGPPCAAPARLDQLGVYRLPHVLPLPHALPLAPLYRHRQPQIRNTGERIKGKARFGSAPDLRSSSNRIALPVAALRRPLRRYALSVDEPPQSAVSASAADSECGSQSSLALDLHASGACAGVTLRVRDNTRRRPLARQQRLRDDASVLPTPIGSTANINNAEEPVKTPSGDVCKDTKAKTSLSVENKIRASSAPPPTHHSPPLSTPPSPRLTVTRLDESNLTDTCITIDQTEQDIERQNKQEMEIQTDAWREHREHMVPVIPIQVLVEMDMDLEDIALRVHTDRITEVELERQIRTTLQRRIMEDFTSTSPSSDDDVDETDQEDGQNSMLEQEMSEAPQTAREPFRHHEVEMVVPNELVDRTVDDVITVGSLREVIERTPGLALLRQYDIDRRPGISIEIIERELLQEYAAMRATLGEIEADDNTTVNFDQEAEITLDEVTDPETSPPDV